MQLVAYQRQVRVKCSLVLLRNTVVSRNSAHFIPPGLTERKRSHSAAEWRKEKSPRSPSKTCLGHLNDVLWWLCRMALRYKCSVPRASLTPLKMHCLTSLEFKSAFLHKSCNGCEPPCNASPTMGQLILYGPSLRETRRIREWQTRCCTRQLGKPLMAMSNHDGCYLRIHTSSDPL